MAKCLQPLPGPLGEIDPVAEMCRIGEAELHPTAALLGGMVSQELIKVNSCMLRCALPIIINSFFLGVDGSICACGWWISDEYDG